MIVFLILIFSVLLILGICALLAGMAQYAAYASTEGSVIKWLDCGCCDEAVQFEADRNTLPEAALISYTVGAQTYQLTSANRKLLKAGRKKSKVEVFYNPYNPAESRLKEGSPFVGFVLIAASSLGLVLIIIL